MAYWGLFFSAFLAATLVPFSSEALLITLALQDDYQLLYLWLFATVGNVLGAIVNWLLGYWALHFKHHAWFPFKQKDIQQAETIYQRYGFWSLLFCWLPVIGDPLSFIAGLFRFSILPFIFLVSLGKGLRYAIVLFLLS